MKKVIGLFGAALLLSSSLSAAVLPTNELNNSSAEVVFCDAGWGAVDGYYAGGGTDGFVAGLIFDIACR